MSRPREHLRPAQTADGGAAASVPFWYHTIELGPGVATPGWFDLRGVVERMPWPDVRGKRCLDVGTYDGFMAFELERRGADEVVATDIASQEEWDMPPRLRETGADTLKDLMGRDQAAGFDAAKGALGSSVQHVTASVYELDPAELGRFDVVVCGSLLLHLRDPLRALEAIRRVCAGAFLSAEQIDLPLTVLRRRRPALRLDGQSDLCQWFVPNAAGHRRMLEAAGFSLERWSRPYSIPYGVGHPPRATAWRRALARRILTGGDGVPHQAVLARV